jgi:hypothetical protein
MQVQLFIDTVPPICDIFYLLQTFLSGMLFIYRIDDLDDRGEVESVRALPRPAWIEEHKDLLQKLFGEKRYDNLLEAARSKACEVNMILMTTVTIIQTFMAKGLNWTTKPVALNVGIAVLANTNVW